MAKIIGKIQVDWSDVAEQIHKYVPLHTALSSFDKQAISVIETMMPYLTNTYNKILVDYKVRNLNKGDCGCPVEGWHYDCVRDYNSPLRHENHFIYSNINGTEFLLPDNKIFKVENGEIWNYGRELHRGPYMTESCKRILIRVTETNMGK